MADNFTANAGAGGDTFAADDIGGVKFPRTKLTIGVDGTNSGDVSTSNPLPVTSASLPLPTGASTEATLANIYTRLADGNQRIEAGGATGAAAPARALQVGGSDGTNLQAIKVSAAGRPSVDINGTVPVSGPLTDAQLRASVVPVSLTSTTVTGTVAVTQSGTWNTAQIGGVAVAMNTGVRSAGTQRVTIATDDVVPCSQSGTWNIGTVTTLPALPANQSVNVAQLAGTATDVNSGNKSAGTLRVVLATDQPALTNKLLVTPDSVALPANQSVNVNQIGGVAPALNTGARSAGTLRVTVATDDIVPVSQSGTWTVQPGNTANSTPWLVQQSPSTTGGVTISRTLSAASTNSTNVKGSAGQVYGWALTNTNAAARYVKLYNKATAPTVGTDTPVMTILVPGNATGSGNNFMMPVGIAFATGIGFGITTGVADADTGAVAANEIIVQLLYK